MLPHSAVYYQDPGRQIETYTYICHISIRGAGAGWAGRAFAHPVFGGLKVYKIT